MRRSIVLLCLLATPGCSDPPTPEPPVQPLASASPTLSWTSHRNLAGRFVIDVPGPMRVDGRQQQVVVRRKLSVLRTIAEDEQVGLQVAVQWALFPAEQDDTDSKPAPADTSPLALMPLLASAVGGDKATESTIGGRPALVWTGRNYSKQWSGAVVLGQDRYYILRIRNNGKERLTDAHDRVLGSFAPLMIDGLNERELSATAARIADEDAHDAQIARAAVEIEQARRDKQAAIARGDILPDKLVIEQHVQMQSHRLRCLDIEHKGSRNLQVRLSVKDGKATNIYITETPFFSSSPTTPKPVRDFVAHCIRSEVQGMYFPPDVSGSAKVGIVLGQ